MTDCLNNKGFLTYFRGRVALQEVLKALGIGPGDEVAIQAFTCLAVPLPIMNIGATPLYVDVNPCDLGMNISDLEKKVGPRTRAIILQHTFGIPADVIGALGVARRWEIPLIEDCCHVVGATRAKQEVGSFGTVAFYSFEWGKPVVVGVGGGLQVNDPDLFLAVQSQHERLRRPPLGQEMMIELQYWVYRTLLRGETYWTIRKVYNFFAKLGFVVGTFRPEDLQGGSHEEYGWGMTRRCEARLHTRLNHVGEIIEHHRRIVDRYEKGLRELGLNTWNVPEGRKPVYLRYPILCKAKKALLAAARAKRVELSGIFRTPVDPVELSKAGLVRYSEGLCPVAEKLCKTLVSIPVGLRINDSEVDRTLKFLASVRPYLQ